ncbi:hypothetical protein MYSTI_01723 [Myxococcus stipitatus DSM 14675]|uniref:NAD-dependent epimerase/dehydratase domain-containing protein n=1 Tax=Myxococcus stipitatus (strain DSM 14675 / JCM 12634 / Mx s8) TaxID=1278073 RepID=L7U5E8_MYXSD|nr:hypothetical protein MYSTI_01723 [Myxococcus stipitatus DSM 14675]
MRVLIPGISGGIARKLALRLKHAGHEVAGVDVRPWETAREEGIEVFRGDVRKRAAEDVFRRWRPEAVVHMATVTAFTVPGAERGRINLDGTKAVFDHCATHGVKQLLFVGRHTFYGAAPDSPLYHSEDEPPRALEAIPELADLVASDLYAATALWRLPAVTTAVLRLPYTLGEPGTGTLATFLKGRRVPLVLGYDPLFHVLQEADVVSALHLALEKQLRGDLQRGGAAADSVVCHREGDGPHGGAVAGACVVIPDGKGGAAQVVDGGAGPPALSHRRGQPPVPGGDGVRIQAQRRGHTAHLPRGGAGSCLEWGALGTEGMGSVRAA